MDYEEDQAQELEALESIYSEDLKVICSTYPRVFAMPLKTPQYDNEEEEGMYVLLKFTHTKLYPEEPPLVDIEESENVSEEQIKDFLSFLKEQIQDNLGMVMVFTLVSEGTEWLRDTFDRQEASKAEENRLKREVEEEAERKKLEGTKVTRESFLNWKQKFDEERLFKKTKIKTDDSKLTGKELFMTNKSLNDSDVKFLEKDGEAITVNEELFDLDDLELEDDSDDPSWNEDDCSD